MQNFLFVKLGKRFSKINFSEIMYAEAVRKYVRIITSKKVYLIISAIGSVERVLPASQFCRVHRSYIVSLGHMTDFENDSVYIGDKIFPMGKQYKETLHKSVLTLCNESKMEIVLDNTKTARLINT